MIVDVLWSYRGDNGLRSFRFVAGTLEEVNSKILKFMSDTPGAIIDRASADISIPHPGSLKGASKIKSYEDPVFEKVEKLEKEVIELRLDILRLEVSRCFGDSKRG